MASQPGPAAFFDLTTAIPAPEPPIAEAAFLSDFGELTALDTDLASRATAMGAAHIDLHKATFDLYEPLDAGAAGLLEQFEANNQPPPADLAAAIVATDEAMQQAADAIPVIPDVQVTAAPNYPTLPPIAPLPRRPSEL